MNRSKQLLDKDLFYSKIKYKHFLSEKKLLDKHPQAFNFFKTKSWTQDNVKLHAAKILSSGVLAGSLLLSTPQMNISPVDNKNISLNQTVELDKVLSLELASLLPKTIEPLNENQETQISHILFKTFGITAVPKLGSTKLNNVYGLIGAEQHLPRYPGDTIAQHDEYQKSGITPGLGGWGYFAPSKSQMTEDLYQKEKYYVAVQTLYLPDWMTRTRFLSNWYKHRKVVVVNPKNGKTIVAVIADAGPAWWTGKHFGGSPEVMAYLKLNVGMQKGPVVLYFVDDPDNQVPLGPLEKNLNNNQTVLADK